ncbi:cysteinyl leukotriene receptor 1 [Amia ocellicauda]|uniref:cysteinyl leukotriene receptor 1 n=1 Tax=Amia ocellicauda TaxID=2972642 RepID=UPI00346492F8
MSAPWLSVYPSPNSSFLSSSSSSPSPSTNSSSPDVNGSCGNDEGFKFLAYSVTYCAVFPVALLSNGLALFVLLRGPPSPNAVLMTNLALSDTGFSLTLPLRLAYYLGGGHWAFPDWLCRACVFAFYLNLYTSVLFLTGLSVLRYLAVLYPMQPFRWLTVGRTRAACLGAWAFVALSSSPFLLSGSFSEGGRTRCFEPKGQPSWRRILGLNYFGLTFGFLLPFLTILGCYGRVVRRLQGRGTVQGVRRSLRGAARRRRAVQLISVIMATFLLCFMPYHLIRTAHLHLRVRERMDCAATATMQRALVVTLCLAAANSCLDPLLYYFAGESFRAAVRSASRRRRSSSSLLSNHNHNRSLTPRRPPATPAPPCPWHCPLQRFWPWSCYPKHPDTPRPDARVDCPP